MNKILLSALLLAALPVAAMGAGADNPADRYFSPASPVLTPQERAAVAIGQKWQTGNDTSKPFAGSDGSIRYVYGSGQIQIMCAVLQVCDVALQPGEQVTGLNVGDGRFLVEPAITGSGATETLHLLIKPQDVGLDTTLVVATNRRAYHFRLRSSRTEFMPLVSFSYPEDALAKWDMVRARETKKRDDMSSAAGGGGGINTNGQRTDNLSFDYEVSGSAPWKPVRVYNNGVKTFIEMPKTIAQTEAPALRLVVSDGGVFSDEQTALVNYRPDPADARRLIVDSVFDKAVLIAGVGSDQQRITIKRGS